MFASSDSRKFMLAKISRYTVLEIVNKPSLMSSCPHPPVENVWWFDLNFLSLLPFPSGMCDKQSKSWSAQLRLPTSSSKYEIKSPDNEIKHCKNRFNCNPLGRHLLPPTLITFPLSLFHLTHQSPRLSVTTHNTQYIASAICAIRSS